MNIKDLKHPIYTLYKIFNSRDHYKRESNFLFEIDELIYYMNNSLLNCKKIVINLNDLLSEENLILNEKNHSKEILMEKLKFFPNYTCSKKESIAHIQLKLIAGTYLSQEYHVDKNNIEFEYPFDGYRIDTYLKDKKIWIECGNTEIAKLLNACNQNHTFYIFPFLIKYKTYCEKGEYFIYKFEASKNFKTKSNKFRKEGIESVVKIFENLNIDE